MPPRARRSRWRGRCAAPTASASAPAGCTFGESADDAKATVADGRGRNGRYRALATVPQGGIGDIQLGLRGWRSAPGQERERADVLFPIENDPLQEAVHTDYYVAASPMLLFWTLGCSALAGLLVVLFLRRIWRRGRVP